MNNIQALMLLIVVGSNVVWGANNGGNRSHPLSNSKRRTTRYTHPSSLTKPRQTNCDHRASTLGEHMPKIGIDLRAPHNFRPEHPQNNNK